MPRKRRRSALLGAEITRASSLYCCHLQSTIALGLTCESAAPQVADHDHWSLNFHVHAHAGQYDRVRFSATRFSSETEDEFIDYGFGLRSQRLNQPSEPAAQISAGQHSPAARQEGPPEQEAGTRGSDAWSPGDYHSFSPAQSPGYAEAQPDFRSPAACPVVFVSQDRAEAHILVPESIETGQWGHRQRKFLFVGLRIVQFADCSKVVGWCSSNNCSQHGSHVQALFEGMHYAGRLSEQFAGMQSHCEWSSKLLSAWGGDAGVRHLLQHAAITDSSVHRQDSSNHQLSLQAVRAGDSFNDWGVILQHRSGSAWFCTKCSHVHDCPHLAVVGQNASAQPHLTLDNDQFNRKLDKDFNIETGQSAMMCCSFRTCLMLVALTVLATVQIPAS